MNKLLKGYLFGIFSAVTYGMNPLFGLQLYQEGLKPLSVLFYRFLFASILLGIYIRISRKTFSLQKKQIPFVLFGGLLVAGACLCWFYSFSVMDSGIGAAIMFVNPVFVAVIMALFFHERAGLPAFIGIALSLLGVIVLSRPGKGAVVNVEGVAAVLLSALAYAVYMVEIKVSRLKNVEPAVLTFYVMLISAFCVLLLLKFGISLQPIPSIRALFNALGLAFFPSFLAFLLVALSISHIGATKSAVLGALEPVTAVVIGCLVFHEVFTWSMLAGILLVMAAVMTIILQKRKCD